MQVTGFAPLAAFLEEVGPDGADRAPDVATHRLPARDERLREEPKAPMTDGCYDVVVVGVGRAETRLAEAGITDIAVLDGCDLSASAFDEASHTWTLPTCRARIVVTDQIRSGRENLAPYLGVAVHGVPNYFMVTGADPVADARLDYIAECLRLMRRTGSTRIEVLFSTQRMFHTRGAEKADRCGRVVLAADGESLRRRRSI